jgi:quercetin dioxygenase-like cupin family protein
MKLLNPHKNPVVPTPDHIDVTSQEIAGSTVGAKSCDVKLGTYAKGAASIFHAHPHSEHVFYILKGQLTAIDEANNEITAHQQQALYIPAGEVHMVVNRGEEEAVYIAVTAPPPG